MATLYTTNFAGLADGSAWPAAPWTTSVVGGSGAVVDVQSTAGRLVGACGSGLFIANHYAWTNSVSNADWDVLFDYTPAAVGESYLDASVRSVTPSTGAHWPTTGYFVRIMAQTSTMDLNRWIGADSWSQLGTTTATISPTMTAGAAVRFRLQAIGTTIQVRFWTPGSAEPGTWAITATDSNVTAAGTSGFQISPGSTGAAVTATVDNILATTNGTPTPGTAPPVIANRARICASNFL